MAHRPEVGAGVADADLSGETVLVTGATDGIGRETALALARLGADVLVHGRDGAKGESVVAELDRTGVDAAFFTADFADLSAVENLAAWARERGVTTLVNNAGVYSDERATSSAGIEYTVGVNHLAPFVLTLSILDAVEAADGRVVTVASGAHHGAELDVEWIENPVEYDGLRAYRVSKLANILFTAELARRTDVRANCLHPGFVPGSALWRNAPWYVKTVTGALSRLPDALAGRVVTTVPQAAETSVYLVAGDVDASGQYFADCAPERPSAAARDESAQRRLWEKSVEWAALDDGDVPERR